MSFSTLSKLLWLIREHGPARRNVAARAERARRREWRMGDLLRSRARITSAIRIPSPRHLRSVLAREILTYSTGTLRFRSLRADRIWPRSGRDFAASILARLPSVEVGRV